MTELDKTRFNHSPFITDTTTPNNGWRFKSEYLVKDKNGTIHTAFPNGGAWNTLENIWIEDADIVEITSCNDKDLKGRRFKGGWRIARDIDFFGRNYPIYCNGKFIHLDKIGEDKKIIPIIVYGYRNKHSPGTMHLLTAVGEVVDINDPRPGTDALDKYTQDAKYFWSVKDSEVMSPYEVMRTIRRYNNYLLLREDKVFYEKASALLTEINTEDYQWVSNMVILPKLGDLDTVAKKLKETISPRFKERLTQLTQPNINEDKRKSMLNEGRGPIPVTTLSLYTVPVHSLIRG